MPRKLLLADDSVTIQKVVAIVFAHEEFQVTTVANGEDAIARARELQPDVVLADVVMPGKDGYQVCEALKADPSTRHIPVLLLAGTFEPFDEARATAAGYDGHMPKPFESARLLEKVRELVGAAPAASATRNEAVPPPAAPPAAAAAPAPAPAPAPAVPTARPAPSSAPTMAAPALRQPAPAPRPPPSVILPPRPAAPPPLANPNAGATAFGAHAAPLAAPARPMPGSSTGTAYGAHASPTATPAAPSYGATGIPARTPPASAAAPSYGTSGGSAATPPAAPAYGRGSPATPPPAGSSAAAGYGAHASPLAPPLGMPGGPTGTSFGAHANPPAATPRPSTGPNLATDLPEPLAPAPNRAVTVAPPAAFEEDELLLDVEEEIDLVDEPVAELAPVELSGIDITAAGDTPSPFEPSAVVLEVTEAGRRSFPEAELAPVAPATFPQEVEAETALLGSNVSAQPLDLSELDMLGDAPLGRDEAAAPAGQAVLLGSPVDDALDPRQQQRPVADATSFLRHAEETPAVRAETPPAPAHTTAAAEPAPARVPAAPASAPAADGGEAALRAAISAASREVIEKIAWEVVPQLAEVIIREHIERLIRAREGGDRA